MNDVVQTGEQNLAQGEPVDLGTEKKRSISDDLMQWPGIHFSQLWVVIGKEARCGFTRSRDKELKEMFRQTVIQRMASVRINVKTIALMTEMHRLIAFIDGDADS